MINLDQIRRFIGRRLATKGEAARRIIVVGDSHVTAIEHAVTFKADHPYSQVEIYRFEKKKGDISIGNISREDFLDLAGSLDSRDHIFSVIGGNQYAVLSTVEHPLGLEVLSDPKDGDVHPDNARLIPHRIVASYLYDAVKSAIGKQLREFRETSRANITHLAPPPPKADNEFISRYFEQRFAQLGMGKYGPARPELRLKMWKIQFAALERLCGEMGIGFLPPPRNTVDAAGFLEPFYYAKDATHANRRYGQEALKQIADYVEAADAGPEISTTGKKVAVR